MATSYIGADVDSKMTDLAVERGMRIVDRYRVPTTIPALREVLGHIRRPRELALEEGPLAHWLWRNLRQEVERLVVCDPRRNAYIAKDGDKDDPIDAAKLAELLRGGFLREVYHSPDDRQTLLKRWVGLYHDRVRERTRQINKLLGCCRHYGECPVSACWIDPQARVEWMSGLASGLRGQLDVLWPGLEVIQSQVQACERRMAGLAKAYPIIELWQALPGVGLIRSTTLYAYLDTPWRFRKPEKLWKYCGVGLERCSSGKDRYGRPKTGLLQLAWQVNKRLKDAVVGATVSAIEQGDNPFAARYTLLVRKGLTPANARHTVSRKLLTVMWGMWKTNRPYDPALLERTGANG
jgi:transposase